ncbi:MAG: hypothetical protein ACK4UO_13800 [Pseudolabrys sp.]
MALELHESLKERLTNSLIANLPLMEVQNGKYLTPGGRMHLFEAEAALPDHGPLRDQITAYIDDFPIVTFVSDVLQNELLDLEYNSEVSSQKLAKIAKYGDASTVAKRLISDFQSLPWRYTLSVKLPSEVSELLSTIVTDEQLSPNLRLLKATSSFAEKYPLNAADKARQTRIHGGVSLLYPEPQEVSWTDGAVYLQVEVEGFIGPFGGSTPAIYAERVLKAFLGLGIALRLFKVHSAYFPVPPSVSFYVHKASGGAWKIDSKVQISADVSHTLNEIKLNDLITGSSTSERKVELVDLILREMKAVFSAGSKAEAIVLAAEWLLESYGVRDSRLSYVQSMVVLEVLLGDKAASDEIGLGQLLRNRCAYLIGKNQEERNGLLKDFDDIYKVRSQIVHRGKARLSFKERALFLKLRGICDRVIQREVDLLRAK